MKKNTNGISGRYSLVLHGCNYETQKTDTYILTFPEKLIEKGIPVIKNRQKVLLPHIDRLTTNFNNGQELYNTINQLSPLPLSYGSFEITYQQKPPKKKQTGEKRQYKYSAYELEKYKKTLPLIYKDQVELAELSKVSGTYIPESNPIFSKVYEKFIYNLANENFERYITHPTIMADQKLIEYIQDRIMYNGYRNDFVYQKIKTKLTSYKTMRNIVLETQKFEKENAKKF